MEGRLTGRVAVVTGGGRGLGAEIARRLAAEGASVAVAARSADELDETVRGIVEVGGRSMAYPMDVSDAEAVQETVALVERDLGPVDLLVNNASIIQPLGPVWEVDPADW